ncbi:hypothetical protein HK096_002885 [Nowakowskiella sp. JEL0078]|nr:hypothetical protein HK096_002885 [Nowakowskiella sp. JEL0078]
MYDDDADDEKRQRMLFLSQKYTSYETGLRICGMKIFDPATKSYIEFTREFGRSLKSYHLLPSFEYFFSTPHPIETTSVSDPNYILQQHVGKLKKHVLRKVVLKLTELIGVIRSCSVRLYSASLLIVYEGEDLEEDDRPIMKLIDFAHSHFEEEGAGSDEGAILGLNNLLEILQQIKNLTDE